LQNAIELNPGFEFAWYQLSLALVGKRQYQQALDTLHKVAEINPRLEYIYDQMGRIHLKLKRFKEAVEMHKKAVETAPKLAYLWKNLGVAYLRDKRYWEAVASLNKSLEINKHNGTAHYYLGCSYQNLGERELSIKHFRETLRLLPNHQKAKILLDQYIQKPEQETNARQQAAVKATSNSTNIPSTNSPSTNLPKGNEIDSPKNDDYIAKKLKILKEKWRENSP